MVDEVVQAPPTAIVVSEFNADAVYALAAAQPGLKEKILGLTDSFEPMLVQNIEEHVEKIELKGLFSRTSYDYLPEGHFNKDGDSNVRGRFYNSLPSELAEIVRFGERLKECAGEVYVRNHTFQNYFFLTPVNESNWDRHVLEVVPVTESSSVLFGMFSRTSVRPFTKTMDEQGTELAEAIQMIPFALKEEHVDFLVRKLLESVSEYRTTLDDYASLAKQYCSGEPEPSEFLEIDIGILNHCIQNLKPPYTVATGVFSIQLWHAFSRVNRVVENHTAENAEIISEINSIPTLFTGHEPGYFERMAGFEVYERHLFERLWRWVAFDDAAFDDPSRRKRLYGLRPSKNLSASD